MTDSAQSTSHIEYVAVGDYSGRTRRLQPRPTWSEALMDQATMTQADQAWVEQREVVVGPWERHD